MNKILLADDSETMGKIAQIILRNHQVSLQQSYQRKETLEVLANENFQLLILSSTLKGIQSLNELKNFARQLKHPPILLITSSTTEKLSIDYKKEGFPFVLDKPFTREDFLLKLKECGLMLDPSRQKTEKINKQHLPQKTLPPQEEGKEEELNFNTAQEPSGTTSLPQDLKELETRITESFCNPNSTFFKIIQHMIKEEIQAQRAPAVEKKSKEELKSLIAEHLRDELKNLSEKKESLSSTL